MKLMTDMITSSDTAPVMAPSVRSPGIPVKRWVAASFSSGSLETIMARADCGVARAGTQAPKPDSAVDADGFFGAQAVAADLHQIAARLGANDGPLPGRAVDPGRDQVARSE